ncbi:MAG TPA: hypothetical protein VGE55_05935 [Limnobacter sp.]|uniref:hypothetical protein n=1 Tax=Limnobacter sp. TaxID=2003368 RepID=UPI002EDB360A
MHDDPIPDAFARFIGQLERATGKAVSVHNPVIDLGDARLCLHWVQAEGMPSSVVFAFTLTAFEIQDAATLAHLLSLNRDMLGTCALPACFCLDESGHHVQFQQRMLLEDMPIWALERYIHDTLERMRELFVIVVKP